MNAADWQRIEEIFLRVVDQPAEQRDQEIALHCGDDARLRREVESLLAGDAQAQDPFESAIAGTLEAAGMDAQRQWTRIGPYRILHELGRGGMGIIYLAEREDQHFHQRVAIKVLKRGLDTDQILARLRQERQILASFEHPNIPRLLGGGATDLGHPYLAMEYVDGVPVDTYCDGNRLTVTARLRLFLSICQVVQHAHRSLIVHRDLKPSNLLVTAEGEPKLLDFGIAKILRPAAWPHSRAETVQGMRVMTPAFASPEQIAGKPLTTATDVYSLGVLLHLLLTGRLPSAKNSDDAAPRKLASQNLAEISPMVAAEPYDLEQAATHRATTPARLMRRLRGDLDTIADKAMRLEAEERYHSVGQLAEDIERHLESLPIGARRLAWNERCLKLISRNRALVLAHTLFVSSLIFGLLVSTWQYRRALHQQHRSETILEMFIEASGLADPRNSPSESISLAYALDIWAESLESTLEEYPADRAKALETAAVVRLRRGDFGKAEKLLQTVLTDRENELGSNHPALATTHNAFAELRFEQARYGESERFARSAIAIQRRHRSPNPAILAESLNDLASSIAAQGRPEEAVTHYRQALELRRKLRGPGDPATANTLGNMGTALFSLGLGDEAEASLREAVEVLARALTPGHPLTVEHQANLAAVLRSQNKEEEAERRMRLSLEAQLDQFGERHPQVARSRYNLAIIIRDSREQEAEELFRQALQGLTERPGEPIPLAAEVAIQLADLLYEKRAPEEAERLYRMAVDIVVALPETTAAIRQKALGRVAGLLADSERHAEATVFWRLALSEEGANPGRWWKSLANSEWAIGHQQKAIEGWREALRSYRQQADDEAAAWVAGRLERALAATKPAGSHDDEGLSSEPRKSTH